ncbi:uncharacterized protein LOC101848529, partial [Aplysia californica]|uniref:Uncharacterized protein LOC101848529 n=1 Tax=Aplysia californica TaxID=6500 RepID=A0ABM1A1F6_APLCA
MAAKKTIFNICGNAMRQWSCLGRCGVSENLPCSCASTCLLTRTCCMDFADLCYSEQQKAKQQLKQFPGIEATCDKTTTAFLVSNCPAEASDEERRLCEETGDFFETFKIDSLPVQDLRTQFHFRNEHCWRCWNDFGSFEIWQMKIPMSSTRKADYDGTSNSMLSFMRDNRQEVMFSPQLPNTMPVCLEDHADLTMIASCPSCASSEMTRECVEGIYAPVKDVNDLRFYKNHFCLLCNNLKPEADIDKPICSDYYAVELTQRQAGSFFVFVKATSDQKFEFTQTVNRVGTYVWNKVACSATSGSCETVECSDRSIKENGICNPNVLPFTAKAEVCMLKKEVPFTGSCRPDAITQLPREVQMKVLDTFRNAT